jgi:hypothetical protein
VLWLVDQLASCYVSRRFDKPLAKTRIRFKSYTYWVEVRIGNELFELKSPWDLLQEERGRFREFLEQQIKVLRCFKALRPTDRGAYAEWSVVIKRLLADGSQHIKEEDIVLLEMEKLGRESTKLFQHLKEGMQRGEDMREASNAIVV